MLGKLHLATSHVVLPVLLIIGVRAWPVRSWTAWGAKVGGSGSIVLLIFVIGGWSHLNIYLRYLLPLLFLAAVIASVRGMRGLPLLPPRQWKELFTVGLGSFLFLMFSALLGLAVLGQFPDEPAVNLDFPLKNGLYYVGQGGSNPLLNIHSVRVEQRYAMDIVKLRASGFRLRGFRPGDLASYEIYGEAVLSPCDGTVEKVVRNLPDLVPPASDLQNAAGNHVMLRCKGVQVLLAHLQHGTATVRPGDRVTSGQQIGRVGNSGSTSEPHLHIHAEREGIGVPILFDGRFLVSNSLIRG